VGVGATGIGFLRIKIMNDDQYYILEKTIQTFNEAIGETFCSFLFLPLIFAICFDVQNMVEIIIWEKRGFSKWIVWAVFVVCFVLNLAWLSAIIMLTLGGIRLFLLP
jgi:hypothetical protein